jgi:cell division protein FtsB
MKFFYTFIDFCAPLLRKALTNCLFSTKVTIGRVVGKWSLMLASQLKRVIELDRQINQLHRELASLYAERAQIVEDDRAGFTRPGLAHQAKKQAWTQKVRFMRKEDRRAQG